MLSAHQSSRTTKLIDSMPIVLAAARRCSGAKVAPEIADKGYCGSKNMYYYGVKLHVVEHNNLFEMIPYQFQSG